MSIPKKIHYCWFGGAELPELAIRCMESWREYCPDYEIICWDESNSDLESCQFVREAYAAEKWAFVSDYMRLKVVEEHGGIYLDIDVELLKPLDPFLEHQGFMGFEQAKPYCVNTGLGFGAVAHHPVIQKLMENYENTPFVKADGSFDMLPCPARDTEVLISFGLNQSNERQVLNGIAIYPFNYFSPVSVSGVCAINSETVSVHHYNGSWLDDLSKKFISNKKNALIKYGGKLGQCVAFYYTLTYNLNRNGVIKTISLLSHYLFRK